MRNEKNSIFMQYYSHTQDKFLCIPARNKSSKTFFLVTKKKNHVTLKTCKEVKERVRERERERERLCFSFSAKIRFIARRKKSLIFFYACVGEKWISHFYAFQRIFIKTFTEFMRFFRIRLRTYMYVSLRL